ncbi:extracellular solute-binding protein [Clostridium sp. AL.422]|uniref:extracellular solute-binding protein n=1 Tax=Clostridium TaxID=1485 RepID=UPI00293DF49C|nr:MULTISPECIES: extracellular solute-binding protein [unclassified Clostridium]MDV4149327.1 extracellular solute-binding protein [Clostridium sp. AL.422]
MKKVSIFFTIIVLLTNIYGCGEKNIESEKDPITLTMWHIWTQKSNNTNGSILEGVIEEWNKNNPQVQIRSEVVENTRYKTKIKTAVATNELPDIFFSWGRGFSKPFIESGKVLSLDSYIDNDLKNKMKPNMFDNAQYNGEIYGIPITLSIGTFYYNKKLFDESGIDIPKNYDELLYAIKTFSDKGIIPLGASRIDNWTSMLYYDILALQEGGKDGVEKALNGDNYDLLLKVAIKMKDLVRSGAFKEKDIDLNRDELEMKFKNGEVAMYYTGNWFIGDLESSLVKDDIVIGNFPGSETNSDTSIFMGGPNDHLMISNECEYKEEAFEAIKFISQRVSEEFLEFGAGLPVWEDIEEDEGINRLSKELKELTSDSTYFLYWDIYLGEEKGDIHKKLVDRLINDEITPEEFAEIMSNLK